MEKRTRKRRYDRLAIVTTSTGAILLIISIIRGAMMLVALSNGIQIHTIRDVSFGVINFAFDFAIPFIGGIILIAAGMALLNIEFNSIRDTSTMEVRRNARNREIKITGKMLNDGDKKILDMLTKDGSMLQSDIVSVSGFSKVKVHRIVRKLENIGLVKVSRFGITNRVMLVDNKSSAFNVKA
ncbi:MAG: winged helix-turn-helix transcriptional regulator [Candidatus Micrarchaeaceae archaeon]